MRFIDKQLDLALPRVMGILNVTPDSFSDGGQFVQHDHALRQVEKMITVGADFIDIGGESTRPGAKAVSVSQELERVLPIIEAIKSRFDTVVSIDTSKAAVITEAVKSGAGLVNDVRALREDGALLAAKNSGAAVCLMHMQGHPRTMQHSPTYTNVIDEVTLFLRQRVQACLDAGIAEDKIIIDPGFGFGKSLQHNYQLLGKLEYLHCLNLPILVGISRKSMLGDLLKREINDRLAGSIATATISLSKGAQIIRVHDVKETVDAVKIVSALHAS